MNDMDWGDDSAEKDEHLLEYFVSSDVFRRLAEYRSSIVVGRKGSGKSALLKKLEEHFRQDSDTFITKVNPKFHTLRTVLNDRNLRTGVGEEIFFQHTWLRQLLLDFLCQIGHNEKGNYCSGSQAYARQIAVDQDRTPKDFVENISEILGQLKLKAGNLGEFGLSLEKELRNTAEIDALQHHVSELCNGGAKCIALIDDLDLGWDNSDTANNLLLVPYS